MTAYSVMLHHFYNDKHPRGQGAISGSDFEELIGFVGRDKIIPAEEYKARASKDQLRNSDVCLSFDDALLCQYEIAEPVLRKLGITAFWFVYSSVFEGNVEMLEIYRYFRTTEFNNIDEFYGKFFQAAEDTFPVRFTGALKGFVSENYLADFSFYTRNDRIFRFLRDNVLGPEDYKLLMAKLMRDANFDPQKIRHMLWMNNQQIRQLRNDGHVIGLHSYSHPTMMESLPAAEQRIEYQKNFDHLIAVLGEAPKSVSHPCNSYNKDTLKILDDLGIVMGFRANMAPIKNRGRLELMREDHSNIMKRMRQ